MVIALLDDERSWLNKAESVLLNYAGEKNIYLELLCFERGQELLSYAEKPIDAAFVDIELPEENGIAIAGEINRQWPACQVVYCTDYLSYALDVYETKHVWFLVKSQMEDRLDDIMNKIMQTWRMEHREVYFQVIKGEMTRFLAKDICYFERKTRVTLLVTEKETYYIKEKIDDIVKNLPMEDFSRCHSSYVVNFSRINRKNRSSYELKSGETIPISRSYATKTKGDYLRWCSRQMD